LVLVTAELIPFAFDGLTIGFVASITAVSGKSVAPGHARDAAAVFAGELAFTAGDGTAVHFVPSVSALRTSVATGDALIVGAGDFTIAAGGSRTMASGDRATHGQGRVSARALLCAEDLVGGAFDRGDAFPFMGDFDDVGAARFAGVTESLLCTECLVYDGTDRIKIAGACAPFTDVVIAYLSSVAIRINVARHWAICLVTPVSTVVIAVTDVCRRHTAFICTAYFVFSAIGTAAVALVAIIGAVSEAITASDAWDAGTVGAGKLSVVTPDRSTIFFVSTVFAVAIVIAGWDAAAVVCTGGSAFGAGTPTMTGRHRASDGQIQLFTGAEHDGAPSTDRRALHRGYTLALGGDLDASAAGVAATIIGLSV